MEFKKHHRALGSIQAKSYRLGLKYISWTSEEISFLQDNWMNSEKLEKELSRHSWKSIRDMGRKYSLDIRKSAKPISEIDRVEILNVLERSNYSSVGLDAIYEKSIFLQKYSKETIKNIARENRMFYDSRKISFDENDRIYIEKNYGKYGPKKITEDLKFKYTASSISRYAKSIGIYYSKYSSEDLDTYIQTHYKDKSIKEISNIFKISEVTVSVHMKNLKLTSPHSPRSKQRKILCVETDTVYSSVSDAMRSTKITSLAYNFKKGIMLVGGYHWRYIDDES